jgi:uncharacterized membrane protein YhaH (DUF805 family)
VGILTLLFSFSGRINRAQYWLGGIGAGLAVMTLAVVLVVLSGPGPSIPKEQQLAHFIGTFALLFIPALLLISWIGYALAWKRFHDRGKSGTWVFLPMPFSFMMMTGVFGAIASGADPAQMAFAAQPWSTILMLIQLWFFVELGCLPSKPGPNKFGDQPGGGSAPTGNAPSFAAAANSAPKKAGPVIPGMVSTLGSAESAMDRAIAERAKQQAQTPAPAAAPRAPVTPAGGLRPATSGSFGRKVTQ